MPERRGVLDPELQQAAWRGALGVFASPLFDAWRAAYATAVVMGLMPRSMLASRDVERLVDALERSVLGPFARGV
jgi:hypothetical protein